MNRYEEIVKLYKTGVTDRNEIAKKLNISSNTVKTYLTKARKEGLIEKKLKYDLIVNLYNEGLTDYDEIAKELNISRSSLASHLTRARKAGAIEKKRKTKTKYEQIIDLYKNGVTDYDAIANKLNIPKSSVITYISKASTEGKIEVTRRKKLNSIYEQVIKLYKSGTTDYKEIARALDSTERTVITYLSKAKKEGLIEKKRKFKTNTIYEQVKKEYKEWITNYKEIAEKLNISMNTAKDYITKIRNEKLEENETEQTEKINNDEKEENVKDLNEKEVRTEKLKQIPLYREIILNAKEKNISPQKELYQMILELKDPLKRIELAQICFLLNNIKAPEAILNGIISSTSIDENIKKIALQEKNKIINELKNSQNKLNSNPDSKNRELSDSEPEK